MDPYVILGTLGFGVFLFNTIYSLLSVTDASQTSASLKSAIVPISDSPGGTLLLNSQQHQGSLGAGSKLAQMLDNIDTAVTRVWDNVVSDRARYTGPRGTQ